VRFAGAAQQLGCAFGLQLNLFVSLAHSEVWPPGPKPSSPPGLRETPLGFVSLELGRSRRAAGIEGGWRELAHEGETSARAFSPGETSRL